MIFVYPEVKYIEIEENKFLHWERARFGCDSIGLPNGSFVSCDLSRSDFKVQEYEIKISDDGIKVSSNGEGGAKLAFQTLRQLSMQVDERGLPYLYIRDLPEVDVRGFMLDISRCKVLNMQALSQLVDQLALFKFNRLELYTEHTFTFSNHELVWGDASPMTPQQYIILDEMCRKAGIELVPNMNSLGHFDRWLRYEEYEYLADIKAPFIDRLGNERPYPTMLKPDEDSIKFIESLYEEFLKCFSSKNFNVGGDEPWELGLGKSREECDRLGKDKVYMNYLKRLSDLCASKGKRMHFWADVFIEYPYLSSMLPDDAVAVLWGYYMNHPFDEQCSKLVEAGRKFMIACGTNTWNSFGLRLDTAFQNISSASEAAKKYGAEGIILTNWGDNGNHQPFCALWLPAIAFAQATWSKKFDESNVCKAADMFIFGDKTENFAKAVCELGRVDPETKLMSLHHKLFFWSAEKVKKLLDEGCASHFPSMLERLEKAVEYLSKSKPTSPDAGVCLAEIDLAIRMTHWAIMRAIQDPDVKSIILKKNLKLLRNSYQGVWLARARVGGLVESSSF